MLICNATSNPISTFLHVNLCKSHYNQQPNFFVVVPSNVTKQGKVAILSQLTAESGKQLIHVGAVSHDSNLKYIPESMQWYLFVVLEYSFTCVSDARIMWCE